MLRNRQRFQLKSEIKIDEIRPLDSGKGQVAKIISISEPLKVFSYVYKNSSFKSILRFSPSLKVIEANDHLIEFHLIEIVIFHLIESFN